MRLFNQVLSQLHVTHFVHAELKALSVWKCVYTFEKSVYTFEKCIHFWTEVYTLLDRSVSAPKP